MFGWLVFGWVVFGVGVEYDEWFVCIEIEMCGYLCCFV